MWHGIQTDAHTLEFQLNALTAIWVQLQNCVQNRERERETRNMNAKDKKDEI